ncbi:MAG: AAA family ATPase [Bacteroidales bacterium]|nr:AAA family ATPase [Bacteroidales bacterium]MBS3773799.1 AAA family ATPase [Bacteroidales bacterium]
MKLKSFRIKNYRSIIDSGWCNTANDNITILIGQNESGKTTVLEALESFYTGKISEDILRSDLSMPEVYCSFELNDDQYKDIVDINKLPPEALNIIKKLESISICRTWEDLHNSRISIEEEAIRKYWDKKKEEKEKLLNNTRHQLAEVYTDYEETKKEYDGLINRKDELDQLIRETEHNIQAQKKTLNKSKKNKNVAQAREKLNELQDTLKQYQEEHSDIQNKIKEHGEKLQRLEDQYKLASEVENINQEKERLENEVQNRYRDLKNAEAEYSLLNNEKERRNAEMQVKSLRESYKELSRQLSGKTREYGFKVRTAAMIMEGTPKSQADKEVTNQMDIEDNYYDLETLGSLFFDNAPVFEFFHDFSSLLPNKIDLEDIINEKENVKGFKAVKNYLEITNLKPEFFNQKNSRILKQKIEKLNNEITVDFHEYWRQNVGKNNKIHISFEMEHYDHNTPEKVGKPYIEFWIKDKDERLYPQQRSRGVRWFLSFYLELKAFAKHKNRDRVLLIDEPALSLHARAQEDVLKVFEDLKNDVQILYTTHSPHLINVNKLYRILALQRADEEEYSETVIFEPGSFKTASSDTLSPIYVLMGTRLNDQKFVQKDNNIIVEDIASYYFFNALYRIVGLNEELYFLPASDVSNVTSLANLLMGWKLGFYIILGNHDEGRDIYDYFRHNLFQNDDEKTKEKILILDEGFRKIEDIFSTLDFKKHILNKRIGITEANSDYIENNNMSRSILGSTFLSKVQSEELTLEDFDEETRETIYNLVEKFTDMLGIKVPKGIKVKKAE